MTTAARARAGLGIAAVLVVWAAVLPLVAVTRAPAVAIGAAIDLTLTAGLAMYVLAVRGGHLPRWALTLTVAAGALAARFVLVAVGIDGRILLAVALTAELAALALVLSRLGRARRAWRAARADGLARPDALERALAATGLPPLIRRVLATELHIVGSSLSGWRRPRRDATIFTSHRTNGWTLFAGVLVVLTLVETPLLHIALVALGHPIAAWIATGLSLYSIAWLVGDLHALRHGGIVLTAATLELRLGARWRATIPRSAIVRIERCTGAPSKDVDFSILGANVLVTLAAPHEVRGLFGRRRTVSALALSIDEPERCPAA
ncbi:MAG: hypothetical protein JNL83_01190 [Myxococcales bacterium]|nr:hypothetical protein [Myxococcales bacterium]